jgi:BirA family biotin operon repressor/biotin-[acetyl-CoA-carboxylase] ligase
VSELLDRDKILSALQDATRAQLQSLTVAVETTSTQADALAAPVPPQGCAVFLAEQQSAGQGRHGRTWTSPPAANLYLSLSRRFPHEPARLSGLSLITGIATAEALNTATCGSGFSRDSSPPITLKWPNDLLANNKKLAGILTQLRIAADGATDAIIGIGINVRMPAEAAQRIDQPWCDLSQVGCTDLSRNVLTALLLDHLLPALEQFEREGLSHFLPRWRQLDAFAGKPVRILDGPRVHEGIALGITDSGALRVRQGEQERVFHSGEVSLRSA